MKIQKLHWILVTGAGLDLADEEIAAADEIGAMLARNGYGLIVGDWPGVDYYVKTAFLEALPSEGKAQRIQHVANYPEGEVVRVPGAAVLEDEGPLSSYSQSAVLAADAGIIVSGREGSKPSMQALLRHGKPVLPVPFLGWDAFEIYREMLAEWDERPVHGLTERQFLELMKPWRRNPKTVARILKAALTTEPEIFVSYRRDDVSAAAGRVFDELAHAYGQKAVFIDYRNLYLGQKVDQILEHLAKCRVLIAVIGPNWNEERLSDSQDYVRREIETAAESKLTVIPLLVGRQTPPQKAELPESLGFIWDLNFATLQMNDWENGVKRLRDTVDKSFPV